MAVKKEAVQSARATCDDLTAAHSLSLAIKSGCDDKLHWLLRRSKQPRFIHSRLIPRGLGQGREQRWREKLLCASLEFEMKHLFYRRGQLSLRRE